MALFMKYVFLLCGVNMAVLEAKQDGWIPVAGIFLSAAGCALLEYASRATLECKE
jgi:hypothetical protein